MENFSTPSLQVRPCSVFASIAVQASPLTLGRMGVPLKLVWNAPNQGIRGGIAIGLYTSCTVIAQITQECSFKLDGNVIPFRSQGCEI